MGVCGNRHVCWKIVKSGNYWKRWLPRKISHWQIIVEKLPICSQLCLPPRSKPFPFSETWRPKSVQQSVILNPPHLWGATQFLFSSTLFYNFFFSPSFPPLPFISPFSPLTSPHHLPPSLPCFLFLPFAFFPFLPFSFSERRRPQPSR